MGGGTWQRLLVPPGQPSRPSFQGSPCKSQAWFEMRTEGRLRDMGSSGSRSQPEWLSSGGAAWPLPQTPNASLQFQTISPPCWSATREEDCGSLPWRAAGWKANTCGTKSTTFPGESWLPRGPEAPPSDGVLSRPAWPQRLPLSPPETPSRSTWPFWASSCCRTS